MGSATEFNRETYERLWSSLSDFIRYNPGARHRRRAILALAAKCGDFRSVLDVGCGNAELLRHVDLAWPGRQLTGVDLSANVVAANREKLPGLRFEVANIEAEDLPGQHDLVLCTEVIEHLDDAPRALRRLAAACAPGGHVIVTCPTGKLFETERRFGHVRHPRPAELRRWAEDAGLVVRDLEAWGFPLYAATKWATNLDPDYAMRSFGGEQRYGIFQIAVSTALYAANFVNLRSSRFGVQLFARFSKPAAPGGGAR